MEPQIPFKKKRFRGSRSVISLIFREMATSYGRSPGGYIWAILEPVAGTALLTIVFSLAFRSPPLGSNFALFYATGLLPFFMYMDVSTKVSQSISFSRQLLFYPNVLYIDTIIARFLLNTVTQLLVFGIVILGVLVVFQLNPNVDLSAVLLSLSLAMSLGFGVGVINCFINSMFPIWIRIWSILNRPLFIISCIFILPEFIPEPYHGMIWYNPLVHVVSIMRKGFYPTYEASVSSHWYVFGLSLALTFFGLVFLNRYHRHILNN